MERWIHRQTPRGPVYSLQDTGTGNKKLEPVQHLESPRFRDTESPRQTAGSAIETQGDRVRDRREERGSLQGPEQKIQDREHGQRPEIAETDMDSETGEGPRLRRWESQGPRAKGRSLDRGPG